MKYHIPNYLKLCFLRDLILNKKTIKEAAADNNINYSSAKSILNSYKTNKRKSYFIEKLKGISNR